MHYYQFHIADFTLHTTHLSLEEEAVYRRLLDYYYDTEKPIPKETNSVIRRLRLVPYADTVASILSEFFVLQPDGWHNLRADFEIENYHLKADTARANGKKGGRPKKNNPAETELVILANPAGTGSKANQEPVTINQETITNKPRRQAARKITLAEHIDRSKEAGIKAIPEDHHVFTYAEEVGLPLDYLRLAWRKFVGYYTEAGKTKKYIDWPATFANNVKNNFYKLWWINDNGEFNLTTAGKQAEKEFANHE